MSMITGTVAKIIRQRGELIMTILIITTVAIITGVILGGLLSTHDAFKADLITVVKNLIIPAPTAGPGLA